MSTERKKKSVFEWVVALLNYGEQKKIINQHKYFSEKKKCSMIINLEHIIYEEDGRSQCKDFILSTSRKYVCFCLFYQDSR